MRHTSRLSILVAALVLIAPVTPASGAESRLDPEASWIVAVTAKAGAFGFLGHEHAILVTAPTSEIDWRPASPGSSRLRLAAPTAKLEIDTPRARELAGLRGGPDQATIDKVRAKMLDAEHLDPQGHPEIVFELDKLDGPRDGKWTAAGTLTARGQAQSVRFPVEVAQAAAGGGGTRFKGSFTVLQTRYGIEPESVAGVVKVADEVAVRFQLTVRQQ
jgi:polyisoprenoid-binding protein YceI